MTCITAFKRRVLATPVLVAHVGLGVKLLALVIGVSAFGIFLSSVLSVTLQREQAIETAETDISRLSNAIKAGIEGPVANRDWTTVNTIARTVYARQSVRAIRVLDQDGIVRSSADPTALGRQFHIKDPECSFCHGHSASGTPRNKTTILTSQDGNDVLTNVNLIYAPENCPGCSPTEVQVSGILMIEMPMTDLNSLQTATLLRVGLSGLVSLVLLLGLMIPATRRFIQRPISELVRGAGEIGAGNLNSTLHVSSHDEFGELGSAFEGMRRQLQTSRAKIQADNLKLSLLNEIALGTSKLDDLQQVLDLALDTIVDRLQLQAGYIQLLDRETGQFVLSGAQQAPAIPGFGLSGTAALVESESFRPLTHAAELVFIPDIARDARFSSFGPALAGCSLVNIPLRSRLATIGNMVLIGKPGNPLSAQDIEGLALVGHQLGIAIDNTLLFARALRGAREEALLFQLGMRISASLELEFVVEALADGARQILGADIGLVGLLDADRRDIVVKATTGSRTDGLKGFRVPVMGHETNGFLSVDKPLIIESCSQVFDAPHDLHGFYAEGVVSLLGVPLRQGDELLGLVMIMMRRRRSFTPGEAQILSRLAHHAVSAIENARLYQQVRYIAVLQERDRLARELHDDLAQTLGYIKLKCSILDDLLERQEISQCREGMLELKQVAGQAYTGVREAIFSLRTIVSPNLGLVALLQGYLAEYKSHYGLDVALSVDSDFPSDLPTDVNIQVVRVLQEALTNAYKHAQASRVWIRFERAERAARITIQDDGCGFDWDHTRDNGGQHYGLQIMRERMKGIGGSLEIDSMVGRGTRIVMNLNVATLV